MPFCGWRDATRRALYDPGGFYRRERPAAHFRTSVHASAAFARALLRLAHNAGADEVVDVGAGGGELLRALNAQDPGLRLTGVDLAPRPPDLPAAIAWTEAIPAPEPATSRLLLANEWLDNVPVDVAQVGPDGVPRLVLVDPSDGSERLGDPASGVDAEWLERWWPIGEPGRRAEIGHPRDEAWAEAVRTVGRGLAVVIDYVHVSQARPPLGSLAAYRAGRAVVPVPDGTCDITAHVALDACAAAGERAGATATVVTTQRAALTALGVSSARPSVELARADPPGYLAALAAALEATELIDPHGLGAFGWLVQTVGLAMPAPFGRA